MANKYEKKKVIAQSAASSVFLGSNVELGSDVVIKELSEDLRRDTKRRERFFEQAAAWAGLSHPGLVRYLDVHQANCWIIMEPMAGDVSPLLTSGVPIHRGIEIARQILEALDYLHRTGYLHGNLKPSNLLFDKHDRLQLSDGFGRKLSNPGVLPYPDNHKYIAPELIEPAFGRISSGIDLYCTGFLIIEMLIGDSFANRFKGVGANAVDPDTAWLRWHTSQDQLPPTRELVPDMPHAFGLALDGLLKKNVSQRLSARDALEELSRIQVGSGGRKDQQAKQIRQEIKDDQSGGAATAGTFSVLPDSPIVFRFLSGARSGDSVGFDSNEIQVGDGGGCDLRIDTQDYPGATGQLLTVRRESTGWHVSSKEGIRYFINTKPVTGTTSIRSGEIIRFGTMGPDIQFLLQSPGAPSLVELARQYLGIAKDRPPQADKRPSRPATAPANPVANTPPAPVRPERSERRDAVAPRKVARPAPPTNPANDAPIDPRPQPPVNPATDASETAPQTPSRPKKNLLDTKSWDKNKKNWALAIVCSIIGLTVVYLIPTGNKEEPPSQTQPNATPSTHQSESGSVTTPSETDTSTEPSEPN